MRAGVRHALVAGLSAFGAALSWLGPGGRAGRAVIPDRDRYGSGRCHWSGRGPFCGPRLWEWRCRLLREAIQLVRGACRVPPVPPLLLLPPRLCGLPLVCCVLVSCLHAAPHIQMKIRATSNCSAL